jgi:hypothetical protein
MVREIGPVNSVPAVRRGGVLLPPGCGRLRQRLRDACWGRVPSVSTDDRLTLAYSNCGSAVDAPISRSTASYTSDSRDLEERSDLGWSAGSCLGAAAAR